MLTLKYLLWLLLVTFGNTLINLNSTEIMRYNGHGKSLQKRILKLKLLDQVDDMEKPDYESTKITGSELSEGDPRDRVETVEDDDEDLNIRGKDKVTSNFQSCFYYQMQTMKDPEFSEALSFTEAKSLAGWKLLTNWAPETRELTRCFWRVSSSISPWTLPGTSSWKL